MDEAEKYQQRLQAIAEKRRMQEEQERAKRDMEDERLRLQQLKRKSLRDQWLMEGPLSSPTSPEAPTSPASPGGPHSPLWGPHSPGTEKRIDELQEESRRLAEGEPPKGQTEGDKTGAVNAADPTEEALQNGQEKTTGLGREGGRQGRALSARPVSPTRRVTGPPAVRQSLGRLGLWPPPQAEEKPAMQPESPRQKTPLLQQWETGLVNGHRDQNH
ncbi:hypothetical protein CRUP_019164 [Coryphaenoides rupestris]|nr:hypothetical protein CRUP_019164 [Coryphaenoides rupestris]